MTFAFDATPLTAPTGGIRRYTDSLTQALAENFPADEFLLLSDQPFASPRGPLPNLQGATIPARRWWSLGLPKVLAQRNAALFHGTDFAVPYIPACPSVMTIHDLSPWHPEWQPTAGRIRRRTPLLLRLGLATMVITPSETIREQVIERFSLRPEHVVAIPLAASETFRPVVVKPPERPYFLFVGTQEPRKNLTRMVEAWRAVRTRHKVDLLIAGREREDFPLIDEPGLRLLGIVPDEDLPALYSGAAACLYPSLYEGFGLPVLEAMQCGALVITSRDPAIMEVTACSALNVDALDSRALAQAMLAALQPTGALREFRDRALARAKDFTWRATAQRTREVYDAAIRVFSRS